MMRLGIRGSGERMRGLRPQVRAMGRDEMEKAEDTTEDFVPEG